jgi:vitamin B12 transporter
VNYVGERDDRDFGTFPAKPVVLGGYATLDLAGEYRVFGASTRSPVAVTVRVENALDRDYEGVRNFSAPGRTVLAGLRVGGR